MPATLRIVDSRTIVRLGENTAEAARQATLAQTAAATAASYITELSKTLTIGRTVTPVTGTSLSNDVWVFATPASQTGTINLVRAFGLNGGGTFKVKLFSKAGDVFTQVGSDYSVTVAAGAQEIVTSIPVTAGQYIGFHPGNTTSGNGKLGYTSNTADSGGWYVSAGGAGNVSSLTDAAVSTNVRLEVGFDIQYLAATVARLDAVDTSITALQAATANIGDLTDSLTEIFTETVGRTQTPVAGTSGGAASYILSTPAAHDGTLKRVSVYALSAGTFHIKTWSKSGDVFTEVARRTVTVAAGLNTFDADLGHFTAIPVTAGEYMGFGAATGTFSFTASTSDMTPWYGGGSAASTTFTDASTTSNRLEVSFKIDRSEVIDVVGELTVLSDALDATGTVARKSGIYSHQLNFINNAGESLGEGSDGSVTTSQEYDNVGFPARATGPTSLLPATVTNLQYSTRGEFPALGGMGHIKELIAEENGIAYTVNDYQLATCNNAVSGAKIADQIKGTAAFTNAMAQIQAIENIATAAGRSYAFQGTFWTQGHNDGGVTTKAAYKAALMQLAADFAADGKAITGQYNNPLLFITQTATISSPRDIAIAQLEASNESDLIVLACPMYQFTYYDAPHINAASAKWLGGYFGLAYKRAVVDKQDWKPLQPIQHAVLGNTIDLFFNKEGLALDTTLMPAQTNSGFEVLNGASVAQTISSVAVIAPNRVRITLASPPSAGWTVRYGVQATTGKSPFVGGGGNLRDSQGDRITYAGNPMHNWCVIFSYAL